MAHCWEAADGLPTEIAALFEDDAELLLAIPERKTPLPGSRKESQSDVFALIRSQSRVWAVTVEGKVNEPFGPRLGDWLVGASTGKLERMAFITELLGLPNPPPDDTAYQLLHRTASSIVEARRFGSNAAAMIVHSFSSERRWFAENRRF